MPFFLLLLAGAVGGLIAWACDDDSSGSESNAADDVFTKPKPNVHFGHSNGNHSRGGYFTHHHAGYRQGHHRRRADGSYIY